MHFSSTNVNKMSIKTEQVIGKKGDIQFNSSGNALIDLLFKGPSLYLDRRAPDIMERVYKLRNLSIAAFEEDRNITIKIIRYFRDKTQQGLKDQPLFMIAALDDKLSFYDILSILEVHNDTKIEGAIDLKHSNLLDLVKIFAWHKTLNGKNSQISKNLFSVFSKIVSENSTCLEQVLRYKTRNIRHNFDSNIRITVGILDILGIIRNSTMFPLPEEVANEYDQYLYPRYRNKDNSVLPVSAMGKEHRQYFKGELPPGSVPVGVSLEQVLERKDSQGLLNLYRSNRLSKQQIKVNLIHLLELVTAEEAKEIGNNLPIMMPHEAYAFASILTDNHLYHKTITRSHKHTSLSNTNCNRIVADIAFQKIVDKYKTESTSSVLCLADVSASMDSIKLSEESSITGRQFSAIMSYFAGHISGHGIFGTWANDALFWQADSTPSVVDLVQSGINGHWTTDLINSLKTTAKRFKDTKFKPKTIAFISDMQFNAAINSRTTSISGTTKSLSFQEGIEKFKEIAGYTPNIVFWNLASETTPALEQDGLLLISGFSAANIKLMLGIAEETNQNKVQPSKIDSKSQLQFIDQHYN
jgi:hypothetical protein